MKQFNYVENLEKALRRMISQAKCAEVMRYRKWELGRVADFSNIDADEIQQAHYRLMAEHVTGLTAYQSAVILLNPDEKDNLNS